MIYNPLTGLHTEVNDELELKNNLIEIIKIIVPQYGPSVVEVVEDENGNVIWTPISTDGIINIS